MFRGAFANLVGGGGGGADQATIDILQREVAELLRFRKKDFEDTRKLLLEGSAMLQAERAAKEKLAAEVVSLKSQVSDLSRLVSHFRNAPTEAPHSFSPVLSTNKWMRRASPLAAVVGGNRGTAKVAERRLSVVWSGTRSVKPSRLMIEPINPSACIAAIRAQCQRRQDRQRRTQGLTTSRRPGLGFPCGDRLIGTPHGDTAPLAQAGFIGRPVRDLVLLAWDVVAAILVQLEGHGGYSSSGGVNPSYVRTVPATTGRSVHHADLHSQ